MSQKIVCDVFALPVAATLLWSLTHLSASRAAGLALPLVLGLNVFLERDTFLTDEFFDMDGGVAVKLLVALAVWLGVRG